MRAPKTEDQLIRLWREQGNRQARAEVAERMLPLVRKVACGYRGRGIDHEDLIQVGSVGLLKAIDRFDPDRGVRLSTYAHPNIAGEIKRHFRDFGWAVRMPRELQELSTRVAFASEVLQRELGRRPSIPELAQSLSEQPGKVEEAIQGMQAYTASSLDLYASDGAPGRGSGHPRGPARDSGHPLRAPDTPFDLADTRLTVLRSARGLPERERKIVYLRYFEDRTQEDIAGRIGISQMQVSRLLRKSLETMAGRQPEGTSVG